MYTPSKLLTSFNIAGFQRYDGTLVLDKLKAGQKLKMVAEPENPYDPCAIELYYKDKKLGYVPRDENGIPSLLMFYGHAKVFEVYVQQVDPQRSPWEQVRVGIFVADNRK